MLESMLFLINNLKIVMSVRRSVIIHQCLLYFWLKLHFIIQLLLLVGMQGLVLSPDAEYPRYATDTHTLVYARYVIVYRAQQTKL